MEGTNAAMQKIKAFTCMLKYIALRPEAVALRRQTRNKASLA